MKGQKMSKVKNAKTKIVATVKVKATGEIAKKIAITNAKNATAQVKQVETAGAFWADIERVAQGSKIASGLAIATRSNGQARRQWCLDNGAKMVDVATIATKMGSGRPENTLRAKLLVLANITASAKKIGYVRVLSSATLEITPKHDLANMVFIYRQK